MSSRYGTFESCERRRTHDAPKRQSGTHVHRPWLLLVAVAALVLCLCSWSPRPTASPPTPAEFHPPSVERNGWWDVVRNRTAEVAEGIRKKAEELSKEAQRRGDTRHRQELWDALRNYSAEVVPGIRRKGVELSKAARHGLEAAEEEFERVANRTDREARAAAAAVLKSVEHKLRDIEAAAKWQHPHWPLANVNRSASGTCRAYVMPWQCAGPVVAAAAGTAGLVGALAGLLLPALGWTFEGVAASSAAAAIQSSIGDVAPGSLFAILQSIGAAGLSSEGYVKVTGAAAATAAALCGTIRQELRP